MDSSKKPLVLMFTDWYYPAYKAGGPVQSCVNLVRALQGEFDFRVVCGDRDLGEQVAYHGIKTGEWVGGSFGEQIFYVPDNRLSIGLSKRLITDISPATVYFNSMFSVPFMLKPLFAARQFQGIKIVLAPRGMLYPGPMAFKTAKKRFFLKAFSWLGWHKTLIFQATAEEEVAYIQEYLPGAVCEVVKNIPAFRSVQPAVTPKNPGLLKLISMGRIHPAKNLLGVLRYLEALNLPAGSVFLTVIGEVVDKAYYNNCRELVKHLPENIHVEFAGTMPHTVLFNRLLDAHIFISPTLGENFGHVIYEALISGKPVLISDQTPWRNLESQCAGWDIPLDQPDLFLAALHTALAMDQATYNEWSTGAYTLAYNYFTNAAYNSRYHALFT